MSPSTSYAHCSAAAVHRNGHVFEFPPLSHASWRFNAHPDGSGIDWEEDLDVDRPHGLDYRAWNHLAKAFRKRFDKEHESVGDGTAGGEHVPGFAQVLRQVDGTADVSAAYDATFFQANGLVHSSGNQSLWCITAEGADPTICLLDPDKQYKGGDVTWSGAQQFDASVDMTILHVDGSATFMGPVRFEGSAAVAGFDGTVDFSAAAFDGTVDFSKRTDFSSIGVAGDATFGGAVQMDATCAIGGQLTLTGKAAMFGGWTSKNANTSYQAETDGIVVASVQATNVAALQGYSDGNNPPTTLRTRGQNVYAYSGPNTLYAGLTMPVRKGDYYEVDASGSTSPTITVFWLPIGA